MMSNAVCKTIGSAITKVVLKPIKFRVRSRFLRLGRFPFRTISMGSDQIGTKLNPRAWAFSTNFLFQFKPVIHNPNDNEFLKYFQLFWAGAVDNTGWKKVQSDPMLIFLSGNRPFDVMKKVHFNIHYIL